MMSTELAIHLSEQAFSSLAAAAVAAGKTPAEQAASVVETIFSGVRTAPAPAEPAATPRGFASSEVRAAVLTLEDYDFDAYRDARGLEVEQAQRAGQ